MEGSASAVAESKKDKKEREKREKRERKEKEKEEKKRIKEQKKKEKEEKKLQKKREKEEKKELKRIEKEEKRSQSKIRKRGATELGTNESNFKKNQKSQEVALPSQDDVAPKAHSAGPDVKTPVGDEGQVQKSEDVKPEIAVGGSATKNEADAGVSASPADEPKLEPLPQADEAEDAKGKAVADEEEEERKQRQKAEEEEERKRAARERAEEEERRREAEKEAMEARERELRQQQEQQHRERQERERQQQQLQQQQEEDEMRRRADAAVAEAAQLEQQQQQQPSTVAVMKTQQEEVFAALEELKRVEQEVLGLSNSAVDSAPSLVSSAFEPVVSVVADDSAEAAAAAAEAEAQRQKAAAAAAEEERLRQLEEEKQRRLARAQAEAERQRQEAEERERAQQLLQQQREEEQRRLNEAEAEAAAAASAAYAESQATEAAQAMKEQHPSDEAETAPAAPAEAVAVEVAETVEVMAAAAAHAVEEAEQEKKEDDKPEQHINAAPVVATAAAADVKQESLSNSRDKRKTFAGASSTKKTFVPAPVEAPAAIPSPASAPERRRANTGASGAKGGVAARWQQAMDANLNAKNQNLTDKADDRVVKGVQWMDTQIRALIVEIQKHGEVKEGKPTVTFGALFAATIDTMPALAATISTAKKRGVVAYSGDMLLQAVHDDVEIALVKDTIEDSVVEPPRRKVNLASGHSQTEPVLSHNEKCVACGKTAYPLERAVASGKVFHKNCFKCSVCKCVLKVIDYAHLDGTFYCQTHFQQLFLMNGDYKAGFSKAAEAGL